MKIYHLKVIHPGMHSIVVDVKADAFVIRDGAYVFENEHPAHRSEIVCCYPVDLTIIMSIDK